MQIKFDLKPWSKVQIDKILSLLDSLSFKVGDNLVLDVNTSTSKTAPYYVPETQTIYLNTNVEIDYFMQVTYQFSHEVIHAVVDQILKLHVFKPELAEKEKINESLASAFSLYFLWTEAKVEKGRAWEEYLNFELNTLIDNSHPYAKWASKIFYYYESLQEDPQFLKEAIANACEELSRLYKVSFDKKQFLQDFNH